MPNWCENELIISGDSTIINAFYNHNQTENKTECCHNAKLSKSYITNHKVETFTACIEGVFWETRCNLTAIYLYRDHFNVMNNYIRNTIFKSFLFWKIQLFVKNPTFFSKSSDHCADMKIPS